MTLPDQLITVGQCVRQRRGLRQERVDRSALALQGGNQLSGQRIYLIRVQRPKQRPEAADQRVQVQRR